VPTYRTGNNAYCIQSIGAAGGTGVAVANTAGAIFGLQRQDLAYDTRTLERSYRDFTFDPARYLGEQETAPVLPSEGGAVGSWDFAGTASGQATKRGTGTDTWSFTGAATGARQSRGTASGAWTFTGASWGWNGLPFTEDFSSGTWDNWTKDVSHGTVAAGFTVSGGAGVLAATDPFALTRSRAILTSAPISTTDQGVLLSVIQEGVDQTLSITLRGDGTWVSGDLYANSGCSFFLYGGSDDTVEVWLATSGVGVEQTLTVGAGSLADRVDGVKYWVRAETVGTTARVRTWADGSPEPTTWTTSDGGTGSITAGTLQVAVYNFDPSYVVLDDITYYDASAEGIGTGSWGFSGTASGAAPPNSGAAAGSWSTTGTASGATTTRGAASGAWDFTGSAVGDAPANSGAAVGSWSTTGTASGASSRAGIASDTWAVTGTASGSAPTRGTASGTVAFTGTAAGAATTQGTASGTFNYTGTATGATSKAGTSSGLTTWAGAAVGDAPVPGLQEGFGAGSWTFTGTATGSTTKRGTGSGSWLYTGNAVGTTTKRGTGSGSWTFIGTATGTAPAIAGPGQGMGTGSWSFTGIAGSLRDIRVLGITEHPRVVTITEHRRALTVTDRSPRPVDTDDETRTVTASDRSRTVTVLERTL
jgi:hypothetical protein